MAISIRHYVFEEGGALKLVPLRVADALRGHDDAIPEFAGTTQRVAQVVLENEAGKPVRILDARGLIWKFDDAGLLQVDDVTGLPLYDRLAENPRGKVVDLRPNIERQKWRRRNTWNVTAEDLDRITAAVWPWRKGQEAGAVQAVKGKVPKEPPLTRDARDLLVKIEVNLGKFGNEIENLSEPALKGLAFALRQQGRIYRSEQGCYEGLAALVEHERELKARRRTGRGDWFARLTVWHVSEDRNAEREVDSIEERFSSRTAATEAARRLLAQNAHRFDLHFRVEVEVVSELECEPVETEKSGTRE
ncbi:hypothetical protein [Methylobacterium organophilum]|uniref:Uncharacterized protein n=1 Tax=Methylobacterium organophilum TaxID=410 RepID=A0ABQ4TEN1_METOR|nr:hypothetical protein [Methylobacterium organophilum]GJE29546.1 hypothetical protein LKMONMHP_4428 [Methylobacterium organophilum]